MVAISKQSLKAFVRKMGNAHAVKATPFLSIVKTYVMPAALYADHKYRQDPAAFSCALLIIVAVVAIADACLMGLMSVATTGVRSSEALPTLQCR